MRLRIFVCYLQLKIMEKKEIAVDKGIAVFIFLAVLIPLFGTFIIEHLGSFKFAGYGGDWSNKITGIELHTPFGNLVETDGKGYTYSDTVDILGKFHTNYSLRLPFYIKAVFADIIYPLLLSTLIIGIYFFTQKFKIKLTDTNKE